MATVNRVVGGALGCRGLSALGRSQSERLRDRLVAGFEPAIDRLYSSSLVRAVETAEILNQGLDLSIGVEDDLVEQRPGDADGLGWHEIEGRFGPYQGDRYPHRRLAPGAETGAEFQQRVGAALHRLVEANLGASMLIACHGGVIDMALRGALGLGHRVGYDLWTLNTSITELSATHPAGEHPDRWRLVRYNDAAHLAGLPASTPPVASPPA